MAKAHQYKVGQAGGKQRVALVLSLLLGTGWMTGCVTTTDGVFKTDPKVAVSARTALAGEYLRNGNLDAAQRSLQEALTIDPRSVEANNLMGVLLQQEGSPSNVAKAESYFKRALELDPKSAQVHNNYGVYLISQRRYRDAIEHFKIAGATLGYDGRAAALENLGRTYLQLSDPQAEQAFKQALMANNDLLIARLELAQIYMARKQIADASALYNDYLRYLGDQPQGARSLWLGIRIARAEHDTIRMKTFINQLAAVYPSSTEYQRYLQLQNNPEAVWK